MLGKRVQQIADETVVGITVLAKHLGFERSVPSKWLEREKAGKDPDYRSLIKVADCLQLSTDWLIGRDHAERWSPAVVRAQERLRNLALSSPELVDIPDYKRIQWVWEHFSRMVPLLRRDTWLLYLGWSQADWIACLSGVLEPGSVQLDALQGITGLPDRWYRTGKVAYLEEIPSRTMKRISELMAAENLDPEEVLRLAKKALGNE